MSCVSSDQLLQTETTCGSLLYELQMIWDEVGESEPERDKMLLELEQECLDVYRRRVDQASRSRAQLRQAIADSEAELAAICSTMGERPVCLRQSNQRNGSLKQELKELLPQLHEMRKRRTERHNRFIEVLDQITKIANDISPGEYDPSKMVVDEADLSIKRLEELHRQLQSLQKEKSDRLKHVLDLLNLLNSLCLVLGMDFKDTIGKIHPSLDDDGGSKSISNDTIDRLASAIQGLRDIKIQRMQKLQDLATSMLELWNLMDTPIEEQQPFQNVTCNIAATEHEITEPDTLSLDFLHYVEAEVLRLEELKASKMKDLVLKKKAEFEELRRRTHLLADAGGEIEFAAEILESGAVDPCLVLEKIELQISNVKEEAFSRKEILEKVEKWIASCEEECWLEEYNRDENRYNAGRGAHLSLKRAEKARALVNKLPAMVEALAAKTTAWEREKGMPFTYDGVPLLSMLEEYTLVRQEKEQERRRQRDQKRLQGQLIAEQEALFGSKPSPSKLQSAKKVPRTSNGGPSNRRQSLGGAIHVHGPKHDLFHAKAARSAMKPDETGMLSAGGRGLDVAGLPAKKLSFTLSNAREPEAASDPPRKPFSPVDTAAPISATSAPARPLVYPADEENRTPLTLQQIGAPKSPPKTVAVPMQMAATPAPAVAAALPMPGDTKTPIFPAQIAPFPAPEEIEYSFEERRAGFLLPKEHVESLNAIYIE